MFKFLLSLVLLSTWNLLVVLTEGDESTAFQQSKNMFNNLTLETFDQSTKEKDIMLVLFYVPWCPHSKAIQPEWEKTASILEQQKEYVLGRVNCEDTGKTLCEKFDVKKYPTVKLFRHGIFQEDFDGRSADGLIDFVQRAQSTNGPVGTTPPSPPVATTTTPSPPQQSGASFINNELQLQTQPQQVLTPSRIQENGNAIIQPQPQPQPQPAQNLNQQITESAPVNPLTTNILGPALVGLNTIQGSQKPDDKLPQQKVGPSLMSLYESVSKAKGPPHPLYPQTFHSQGTIDPSPAVTGQQPLTPKREAAIMNYIINRHEQIKKSPDVYQKLVSSKDLDQIKKYYEWKFQQMALPEKEKQKRIEFGSILLGDKRAKD